MCLFCLDNRACHDTEFRTDFRSGGYVFCKYALLCFKQVARSWWIPQHVRAAFAGTTVTILAPQNDTGGCLQGCYKGDCGPGTDNYLNLASVCDERLSQLWLISTTNKQITNVASGLCISITSTNVVTLAACGSSNPAQSWAMFANGTLQPASNPGDSLTTCTEGSPGCDAKIMQLMSNDGQLMTLAPKQSAGSLTLQMWEETPPSRPIHLALLSSRASLM